MFGWKIWYPERGLESGKLTTKPCSHSAFERPKQRDELGVELFFFERKVSPFFIPPTRFKLFKQTDVMYL